MTTLREAAQQALEALEFYKGCYGSSPAEEAIITALRTALAEPVQCRHCAKFFSQYRCSASTHGECDCPKCQGFCIFEGGNGG